MNHQNNKTNNTHKNHVGINQDVRKKRDFILVISVLAVAAVLYAGNRLLFQKPAVLVEVTVNGQIVQTLDLSKDTEYTIHSRNNGTNLLVIKDGEASVTEASCPDSLCVHQGRIYKNGEMIVCLPNQVIAQIRGGEDAN